MRRLAVLGVGLGLACVAGPARAQDAPARFRAANEQARSGDLPRAIAGYQALADDGASSASLYWNWAQAAEARGRTGEALWALLRARELEPGDAAVSREIERLRQAANLDPAELAPDPLDSVARWSRRFRLGALALLLAGLSVLLHAAARFVPAARGWRAWVWPSLAAAVVAAAAPLAGSWARPLAVVAERGAPLADAASPSATALGTLREGEVVLVLDTAGGYLRVQDSSGARGWARSDQVRPLRSP